MKFSQYIETSPASQLSKDAQGIRKPLDELKYNESAVQEFISAMAEGNGILVADILTRRRQTINEERYQGKIADGLLNISYLEMPVNRQLKLAYGRISTEENWFRFYPQQPKAGIIEIFIPPVILEETDKQVLHSIILHELRHAQDWISPAWKRKMKLLSLSQKESKQEFNELLYIKTLRESRAWGQQLDDLMKAIGNPQKVLTILTQGNQIKRVGKDLVYSHPSLVTLSSTLTDFAKEFLKNYEIKKESLGGWLAGPVAAIGSLSPATPPVRPPTAIVKQDTSQQEVAAANLIRKMHDSMKFRNFVKTT